MPQSSPLWHYKVARKKRRNLYRLPSYWSRLLALPNRSWTATQKPTLVYVINEFGYISPEISCRRHDNHISTGIYRCSILDYDLKFCENFDQSRISADKRFLMYFHYIPLRLTPDRGFCEAVCKRKFTKYFYSTQDHIWLFARLFTALSFKIALQTQ